MTSLWKKKKILGRWADSMNELFENHRKDYKLMKCNFAGPATRKMKSGKATGPYRVSVELFEALAEYGIYMIAKLHS